MDPTSKFAFSEGVLVEVVDGEAILLNPNDDTYFSVNEVGAVLLNGIKNHSDVREMTVALVNEFEIDEQTAGRDLSEFLTSLLHSELITPL